MSAQNQDRPEDHHQDAEAQSPEQTTDTSSAEGVQPEDGQAIDPFVLKRQQDRIKELESKLTDYDIKFIEARAFIKKMESEIEQIRLRSERDAQKVADRKIGDFVLDLLPIVDNFEFSLKSIDSTPESSTAFAQGIRMIHQLFYESLKKLGLEKILSVGESFDPNIHEALMTVNVASSDQDGKVVQELKSGYRLNGQVLRPAQVAVGRCEN